MNNVQKKIIKEIKDILKEKYSSDSSGHDYLHLERVWKMAKKLALGEDVDMFVVEVAALLHDTDDYKFKPEGEDELKNTKEILSKFPINQATKLLIYDIVSHVSFKGGEKGIDQQNTLEGKIVQDADRLDVLGAIGIARTFAYGGVKGHAIYDPNIKPRKNISYEDYKKDVPSINHFYEKLLLIKDRLNTEKAKLIALKRHRFVEEFLKEFWEEVNNN